MIYPEPIDNLKTYFQKLPGVGEKNAERFALAILNFKEEDVDLFAKSLLEVKEKIDHCKVCGNLAEGDLCEICKDETRNKNLICVTEDAKSIISFEKAGSFHGVYHVLDGLISPSDGIGPDDINIKGLIKRVEELKSPELIIALKSTIEGETTTLYIKKIFENKDVSISRLSYGIPIGAEIDYIDVLTLDKALSDRKAL